MFARLLHLSLHSNIDYVSRFTHRKQRQSLNYRDWHQLPIHVLLEFKQNTKWRKTVLHLSLCAQARFFEREASTCFSSHIKTKAECALTAAAPAPRGELTESFEELDLMEQ